MKKALPVLFLAFLAAYGSGCATPYARQSLIGGYSETQLSENIFTVTFKGNGYTSRERASNFSLLRCAEIAIENGYPYFAIIDRDRYSKDMAFTTPSTSYTTGSASIDGDVRMYGNRGSFSGNMYGSARTTTYHGQTFLISKPRESNTILCMNEKPDGNPFVFDAAFLAKSVTKRYHLNRAVYATQVASAQNSAYRPPAKDDPVQEELTQTREPRVIAAPEPSAPTGQRPRLVVKGIVYSQSNPSALVGTEILHQGDTISGAQVVKIRSDSVEFSFNGTTWRQGVAK